MKNTLIYSRKIKNIMTYAMLFVASVVMLSACAGGEDGDNPSLWDIADPDNGQRATITSIEPAAFALSGVQNIEIFGTGFSAVPENNTVHFGGSSYGTVLEASTTRLLVRVADVNIDDAVDLHPVPVRVWKSADFGESDTTVYNLKSPLKLLAGKPNQKYWGIAVDANDNVFLQGTDADGNQSEIVQLAPGAEPATFTGGTSRLYVKMTIGLNGELYGVRRQRAIFSIDAGGASVFKAATAGNLNSMDFDKDLTCWVGSNDGNDTIYAILNDGNLTEVANTFEGNVLALRYYSDNLYIASEKDGEYKVFRGAVDANGNLGTPEEYYDFTAEFGDTVEFVDVNFTTDGSMFVGLKHREPGSDAATYKTAPFPILVVGPDKTSYQFYDGLSGNAKYQPNVVSMAWDKEDALYYVKEFADGDDLAWDVIKVLTQKQTAPYYGRD